MRSPLSARILAALGVVVLLAAPPLRGQDPPTVAVIDFGSFMMGEGGAAVDLGKAISAMLVEEFGDRPGVRIVERDRLNELLRERNLHVAGRLEESDAIEVGRMLGVQYVLHGEATSIVDNLRMEVRAVDVGTSEIVSIMKKSDRTTELFGVVAALADQFGEVLDLTPPSNRPTAGPVPVPATVEFSRAVGYEDQGQIGLAIRHYETTLELHPEHRDARRALERLRDGSSGKNES